MAYRKAKTFTPCRWVDCIYWGVVDEAGSCCNEKQVRVCEDIRAAAAAQNVPDINVGDKETRTLLAEWTEELTLARPLTEEERAAILPEEDAGRARELMLEAPAVIQEDKEAET